MAIKLPGNLGNTTVLVEDKIPKFSWQNICVTVEEKDILQKYNVNVTCCGTYCFKVW